MKKLLLSIALIFVGAIALINVNMVAASDGVTIDMINDISFTQIIEQQVPSKQIALYTNIIDVVNFIKEYNENNYTKSGYTEVFSRLIINGMPMNDSYFHFNFRKTYNEINNTNSYSCYVRLNLEPLSDINYYINNVILDVSLVLDESNEIIEYQTYSSINNVVGLQTYGYSNFYFKRTYTRFKNTLGNVDIQDIVKFYRLNQGEYFLPNEIPDYDEGYNNGYDKGYEQAVSDGKNVTDLLDLVKTIFKMFATILDTELFVIGNVKISLGAILGVPLTLSILSFIIGWFKG